MWINWKRYTLGALLLTSLSLVLFGCSDFSGSTATTAPVTKAISGIVQDKNGQPIANAVIDASAIDDSGAVVAKAVQAGTEKSVQKALNISPCQSNGAGRYTLQIPKDYKKTVLLTATHGATTLRTIVEQPNSNDQSGIMITFATEYLVHYVEDLLHGAFTSGNIASATTFLEQVFVPGFLNMSFSLSGDATDLGALLLTRTNALLLVPGTPTTLFGPTANLNTTLTAINNNITDPNFEVPTLVSTTTLATDTTPPTAPGNLAAPANSITINSVTLTWNASTDKNPDGSDGSGVSAYYIYRDGETTPIATLPATVRTYTDYQLSSLTTYAYTVKARDAAGNFSAASTISVTTYTTHTLSGHISKNGAALPGIVVTVTGAGTGSATTDSSGNYSFTDVRPGTYTITPVLPAGATYVFTPISSQVTVDGTDVTADFTAVAPGSINTGTITNPDGSITTTTIYPNGSIITTTTYPNGMVTTVTFYTNGTITVKTTYPNGTVTVSTTLADGSITATTTLADGTVTVTTTTANGSVTGTLTYTNTSRATTNTL